MTLNGLVKDFTWWRGKIARNRTVFKTRGANRTNRVNRVTDGPKRFRHLGRRRVGAVLLAAAAGAAAAAWSASGCRAPPPARVATRADGQWIWSAADLARWQRARATRPDLRPGLWSSTVWWEGGVRQRLALSPRPFAAGSAGRRPALAVVVRFDDRMHAAWLAVGDGPAGDSTLAAELDRPLATLLRLVAASGADVREVQLDYDCPVRRLARWAAVVARLRAGALRGREVWITSLVAHVADHDGADRDYGDVFRGVVDGHIVQVFDVFAPGGDAPSPTTAARLRAHLERAGLPFRLGVGAFERVVPAANGRARLTHHRAWFALAPGLARSPLYRGLWVFPGGQPWESLVAAPPRP